MVGVDWGEFVMRVDTEGEGIDAWISAGLDRMSISFWPIPFLGEAYPP